VPVERPRIAVASDGTLAAIQEPTRVSVVELPGAAAFAEVGIDPDAGSSDVAWVGAPPRLLVLSRYSAHSAVHLVDPYGPRTVAEIRLESPMKLFATVGSHALAVGALGAAVLTASDTHLTPYQFPARAVPVAAGAAGSQFVVALAGAIEEWDPQSRMPKRRLKLPRPGVITAVGGSDRVVWWTTQGDPTRIDVSPLVNRGQAKQHDLPEPIARVASHPRSDLLVCLGADSGRLYVVDLDGRGGHRVIGPEGIDRAEAAALVVGRVTGVLAAQTKRSVALVALDGKEPDAAPIAASVPRDVPDKRPDTDTDPEVVAVADAPKVSTLFSEERPAAAAVKPPQQPLPAARPVARSKSASQGGNLVSGAALNARFSAWRDRMRDSQARTGTPSPTGWTEERPSWRDAATGWARAVAAGSIDRDAPAAPAIDALLARFELAPPLRPALVLLYGAHLAGEPGAAPIDVARVLGRHWDDALGRGQLADRGIAVYRDSRVRLAPAVLRALDDLPPRTGTLVGTPGTIALLGPCVIVADGPLGVIAEACLASVGGAILAAHPHADPHELVLEARARGAVPLLRLADGTIDRLPADEPIVIVTADDATADQLGLPRLA
jgi:hypothetical protein